MRANSTSSNAIKCGYHIYDRIGSMIGKCNSNEYFFRRFWKMQTIASAAWAIILRKRAPAAFADNKPKLVNGMRLKRAKIY